MNFVVNLTGQAEPLTASLVADYFDQDGENVVWAKPAARRNKVGWVAGTTIRTFNNGIFRNYGRRVGFGGALIPAEYLAFTLEYSRLPRGKIMHRDGNRENNHPTNLIEIA